MAKNGKKVFSFFFLFHCRLAPVLLHVVTIQGVRWKGHIPNSGGYYERKRKRGGLERMGRRREEGRGGGMANLVIS